MAALLPPGRLTVVVNTGDDFDHLGLRICPDIDTVIYMLAGLVDETRGWGRRDENWLALQALGTLGGPTWFNLGDRDLAMHLRRTELLRRGYSLSTVTTEIARHLGIAQLITPMTDDPVRTVIHTDVGELPFQEYFVRLRCEPVLKHCHYAGATEASAAPALIEALAEPNLRGIVVAPSNPILSIAPILAIPEVRPALRAAGVPIVAVSPLIGGRAVKGPADKLMRELGHPPGIAGLLSFYESLIDGLLIDPIDRPSSGECPVKIFEHDIIMSDADGRRRVARHCLEAMEALHARR
jgi:LPPG:FO 2-phospho-L-lactate transferase